MEIIFIDTENSKSNEPRKFVLTFYRDLRSLLLFKTYLFIMHGKV